MKRYDKRWIFCIYVALISLLTTVSHAENFCFIVAGDTQTGQQYLTEIVQATFDENADFILICGDLTDGGTYLEYQRWLDIMQPLYDAGIGVYPVRGNHDTIDGSQPDPKSIWDAVFSGEYALPDNGPAGHENITYSFTHKTAFVIGLDQFTELYRNPLDWLEEQFISNTQPHIFVFGHTPAFKLYHNDTIGIFPCERDIFVNRILTKNGRVYFCGHDHFYDHIRLDDGDNDPNNDLHQFIVNSDSKMNTDWRYYGDMTNRIPVRISHQSAAGYLLAEIQDLDVTLTWKYRSGGYPYQAGDVFRYTVAEVKSPPIYMPDANLKAAISNQLGISEPNVIDMLALTGLDANSLGIFDLTGLEYAKNLEDLYLNDNFVTVAPSLKYLKNLKSVHLNGNPLDRRFYCIDQTRMLEHNLSLEIECPVNPIPNDDCVVYFPDSNLKAAVEKDLGVSPAKLVDMQELFLLESAACKGITALNGLEYAEYCQYFGLSGNLIENIDPLAGNTSLGSLDLSGNQIKDITVLSNLIDLFWICLNDNQIIDLLPLANMMNIEALWVDNNPLNTRSYCEYIPSVIAHNPNAYLSYEANSNPLTEDCYINMSDLAVFITHWMGVDCGIENNWCDGADINHLDDVNIEDFAELSLYWFRDN